MSTTTYGFVKRYQYFPLIKKCLMRGYDLVAEKATYLML